jgi:glycosyltransferase involved in cell wall biosynthesis
MMLGTFGLRPKATLRARAVGIAGALRELNWDARIATVPWDNPDDSGVTGCIDGVEYVNTRSVRPILWPLAVSELVRETERWSPDVVHVFKPKGFGDLAGRMLHRKGIPVVIDMDDWEGHGGWNDALPYGRHKRTLFDWQERTWPSKPVALTVASQTLYQRAIELGAAEDRVFYIPNGLSRGRYTELANPPESQTPDLSAITSTDTFSILLYTRFVEFEPEFVVDILAKVSRSVPRARLVIAGGSPDGSADHRLLTAAHRAGIANDIVRLGWIHPSHLGHIAQACTAALVPFDDTLINRAKCSVKLLELMACGLPIVASNVGENREYLQGGRCGILAQPGNAESHAGGLCQVAAVPEVRPGIREQAQARVARRYLWEHLADDVLNAYDLARHKAREISAPRH